MSAEAPAAPPPPGAQLAFWLPSAWMLALLAWFWLLRVGGAGPAPDPLPVALGLCLDALALLAAGATLRARAAAGRRGALPRIGFAALGGGVGVLRAVGVLAAFSLDRPADAAFARALLDEPGWLWGARWLLAVGALTAPLTAVGLRRDTAAWAGSPQVAADLAAAGSAQGTVAAVALVVAAAIAALFGGVGAEGALVAAWWSL